VEARWVCTGSNGEMGISGALEWAAGTLLMLGCIKMGCNPRGDPRIEGFSV
jgi:hypothetical protein